MRLRNRANGGKPAREQAGRQDPSPVRPHILKRAAWLAGDIKSYTTAFFKGPWFCSGVKS